ncbi:MULTISPECIES: sensor histidine kinase [Bizionia]|uniref:histidine kinase n=1 Tax=Bizionia algoritergicola TaxID=291187 RepID=A0A5D0R1C4_9FLAO|nr:MULTISPECIES: histidine kinase [Bizionia]OBX17535.1 two-component sensor histidine kinase [Bizionia sp. APA-3]TYB74795.1 sensor histidine kinase [Bizionia algoritergicola]
MENEKLIIQALFYGIIFLVLITTGLILFFHYSRRKIVQKELEKADLKLENQQKILQTSIAIQEIERKRIAQDLHDAISSKLNVVSLTTNVLLIDKSITEKQRAALNQILQITSTTLESSRKIAHDLMPPILDEFGLKVALEELFDDFSVNTAIEIEHNVENLIKLSRNNQLHVFRIIQELMNNSIRHGKANELAIYMEESITGFNIRYQDNGVGFNVSEIEKNSGIGLQNIKSRAKILNGYFKMESTKNNGSLFIIQCKYHD